MGPGLLSERFCGKEISARGRRVDLQVSAEGLDLHFPGVDAIRVGFAQIRTVEVSRRHVLLTYSGRYLPRGADSPRWEESVSINVTLPAEQVKALREALNFARVQDQLAALGDKHKTRRCPQCRLLSLCTGESAQWYCPECHAINGPEGILTRCSGYLYNFTGKGLFAMVGPDLPRRGAPPLEPGGYRPYRQVVRPLVDRLASHLFWLSLFFVCSWLVAGHVTWFSARGLLMVSYLLGALMFLSTACIGYYGTILFFRKGFCPVFFPPPWERVAKLVERGAVEEAEKLVADLGLNDHPGMRANLALGHFARNAPTQGKNHLLKAIELCPDHPVLRRMQREFDFVFKGSGG